SNNFDYSRPDVAIWTDSLMMLKKCKALYTGKDIPIVPNIVDDAAFPFVAQSEREPGMIIVFPRKGSYFIDEVFSKYRRDGGTYWRPKLLHRLPFKKLARCFGRAQAFFAAADVEGCALPPQESMAAGVVVTGKDAGGANFCMQHEETALVSTDVTEAVENLKRLEDGDLRQRLADTAHRFISRYFPAAEPAGFWRDILGLPSS
ncbi:MAG: glycosyltransferase, partial [Phycisphaerae bacterium]